MDDIDLSDEDYRVLRDAVERKDVGAVRGRDHAHWSDSAEVAGIESDLVGVVHQEPDELHPRMLDDRPQRAGADVAGRPLHNPQRRTHEGRSLGIQSGSRFSMNASIPSRGSGERSSAPNMVG